MIKSINMSIVNTHQHLNHNHTQSLPLVEGSQVMRVKLSDVDCDLYVCLCCLPGRDHLIYNLLYECSIHMCSIVHA